VVVFSLVSGVVADAWDRRRLMLCTQVASACVALTLATLALRGLAVVWPVYLLAALGAAVGAFDLPARQALVPELVPREHLANAIGLNMIMFQGASVAGPAAAGLLIGVTSVGWTYVVNAVSFGFVIAALLMMRGVQPRAREEAGARDAISVGAALEGLRFVFRTPLIRSTMLLDFVATFFSSATALLPIFAQDILHVGAVGYGWLFAAPALGAFVTSAALVPLIERIERRGQTLLWAVAVHGLATIVFGLSHLFWLTFACLAIVGGSDTVSAVIRNVVRNVETPDRLRGRMTGVNMVFFMGGPQLGELESGVVANWFGPAFAVVSGGIGCLLATAWVAASAPLIRRYRNASEGGSRPPESWSPVSKKRRAPSRGRGNHASHPE
jgi:MFS family permease